MFEPVDEPFDPVSHPIGCTVEWATPFIIALPRDRYMDAMFLKILSDPLGAISLVSDDAFGAISWSPSMEPIDRPMFHKVKESCGVMSFAGSKGNRYRFAFPFRPEVDLGREPTSTTAKSLFSLPPFFAPAAFWCALTTVVSTKWTSQSTFPSESESACSSESIRSHTPASLHLRKRLCMVDHDPYLSGISRQGAPVFTFQRIPLMILRWSSAGRPVSGFRAGRYPLSFSHCFSVSSCLLFIPILMLWLSIKFAHTP